MDGCIKSPTAASPLARPSQGSSRGRKLATLRCQLHAGDDGSCRHNDTSASGSRRLVVDPSEKPPGGATPWAVFAHASGTAVLTVGDTHHTPGFQPRSSRCTEGRGVLPWRAC